MLEIFNLTIFGSDVDWFCALPDEDKKEWIKKYSAQKKDEPIDNFIANYKATKQKDCHCINCGKDASISQTNAEETATGSQHLLDSAGGSKNSRKRQPKPRRAKKD